MKKIYRILLILHLFVGIGGMAGGIMAILNPYNPGGMATDSLNNSPFNNFLIPGIILFTVIGVGNIFSAVVMVLKLKYQVYISGIFSLALVIWIIVQCIMLRIIVYLHIIFFIIGLVQGILSSIILFKQKLFPTNIILNILSKLEENYPNSKVLKFINRLENKFYEV